MTIPRLSLAGQVGVVWRVCQHISNYLKTDFAVPNWVSGECIDRYCYSPEVSAVGSQMHHGDTEHTEVCPDNETDRVVGEAPRTDLGLARMRIL